MSATGAAARRAETILWAEMAALFVGAPVLMTVFFGQYSLFVVLWLLAGVAAALLALTPGFAWRALLRGPVLREWPLILGFAALTATGATLAVKALAPHAFLWMPWGATGLWLMIMVLYPLLSAAPQELIYRTLFFERYGRLFRSDGHAIAVNAALFGLGHLFFLNPFTIAATALAGAGFAWAYLRGRSTLLAWTLHALAGQIVFTLGLGRFFYHGAVG
jgi:membrane protease YdiL (CAAX protease family)